jgi:uncharacterized SAM-binding protein YcdF (DUF218 family)
VKGEWVPLIEALLMPPALPLLLIVLGIGLSAVRRAAGTATALTGALLLTVAALPLTADWLHAHLASTGAPSRGDPPGAIVILGGGSYWNAPEYDGSTVSHATLERVRYGAKVARDTGLPVLVSGGDPLGGGSPEAEQMRAVLEQELRTPVKWVESRSLTTRDNARLSAELLQAARIETIVLVTHAWHMRRARDAFERLGIAVRPAATGFVTPSPPRWTDWVPSAGALENTRIALHEMLGLVWYRLTQTEP